MGNESVTDESKAMQRFSKGLDSLRAHLDLQNKLLDAVGLSMQTLEALALKLAARSGGAVRADANHGALSITANGRTLTFIPAQTVALDSHLHHARCMLSAQVLIFGHAGEDAGSTLVSSFRVYADQLCSTGESSWLLDNSDGGFFSYLVELVVEALLEPELCWPKNEDFSDEVRLLPLAAGKADAGKLPSACIGFECALPRRTPNKS